MKALADRLAEAFAERLHGHVRESVWGYAGTEHLTNQELIRESYTGIRPAPGYPACPDHSLKPILFDMLGGEGANEGPAGVTLTENFAMLPTSAVSFFFGHRDAIFRIARIGATARGLCGAARNPIERRSAGFGPFGLTCGLWVMSRAKE